MANPSPNPKQNPSGPNFADSDIKFGQVLMFIIYSAIFLAILFVGLRVMNKTFLSKQDQLDAQAPAFVHDTPALPPGPHLLIDEPAAWTQEFARQTAKIDRYEWIDQKAGVLRIPVDRAMDLVAEQGLPARGDSEAK